MSNPSQEPACPVKPANLPRPKPVTVNGAVISRGEIAREVQNHPAAKPVEAWLAAARALVVRELLMQEARRLAIAPRPVTDDEGRRETDDEAMMRQLVEQEVTSLEPDDVACRKFYDRQPQRFRSPDLSEVRHILVAADPRDPAARQSARRQAEEIIAVLQAEPARFEALAAAYSACPSAGVGGNLGQISRGQTAPEFDAALNECPIGRLHDRPIDSRYGYHVVLVEQRIEGQPLPFELVRDRIADWLRGHLKNTAIRRYISQLADRATITGIALDADAPALTR